MMSVCVPGGLTGGRRRTSRCFSLGAVHFAFFFGSFLFPFPVGVFAATLFFAPTPPSPTSSTPPLLFFPLFLPFFFCPPSLLSLSCDPSTFARPSSVGRPLFVFLSLVDYFPLSTPPPPTTNQPVSLRPRLLEVTWDKIDRR